jgi:RNAse (barnase) inhibitor barstar
LTHQQEQRSQRYDGKDRIEHHIRYFLKPKLRNRPLLGKISRHIWHTSYWFYISAGSKINSILYHRADIIDINKLIWINPSKIKYCALKEFDINKYKGKVIDGDWDRLTKEFEDLDLFVAIKSVCANGEKWQDTEFYKRTLKQLKQGKRTWKCNNIIELDIRCESIQWLFQDIRNNGYKTQREILNEKKNYQPLKNDDEIVISIGRNGDLLFSDGAHRLSIAKILDIKKIPIKIAVRHPEWCNFRKELNRCAKNSGGKLSQPINHPDLNDFPSYHNCYKRYLIIRKNINLQKGRILDIGANLGYFCDKFEEEGFTCYAVEQSK